MLDIKFIREHPEKIKEAVQKRGMHFDVDFLLASDEKRRAFIAVRDNVRAGHNVISEEISKLEGGARAKKIEESKQMKDSLLDAEKKVAAAEEEFNELMRRLPNIPFDDVPEGKDEKDNKIIREWGKPKEFSFKARDHVEIGEILDIIDIERASKVAGTRFHYLKGGAALLEFALVQFVFQTLTSKDIVKKIALSVGAGVSGNPFVPVVPPVMIRPDLFVRMGRLNPEDKDERYYLNQDDLYLIGSAEHTLGSMHADEIIPEDELPIRYIGFSTSFRREAGSYGKDTRGILRVHQFDKLEMESFTAPEKSYEEHLFLVAIEEYLTQALEIPYRVVLMCAGDMGKPDARQSDIEMWMPGEGRYRETHTADYMTDFQARRLNTRVRRESGEIEFAHTNDATAFAMSRTPIAILENYQEEDGSVVVPKVLRPYMGGMEKITHA